MRQHLQNNNHKLNMVIRAMQIKIVSMSIVIFKIIFTLVIITRNQDFNIAELLNFIYCMLTVDFISLLIHCWVVIHLYNNDYKSFKGFNISRY